MANPVLRSSDFTREDSSSGTMTVNGAIQKSAILIALCAGSGYFAWHSQVGSNLAIGGAIVGFILCLIISFKPTSAPFLAPLYAIAEGLFLGTVSSFFEAQMQGIVLQTIALTVGVLCAMLGAYQMRLIRPTRTFFTVVSGATMGIALVYVASMIAGFFGSSFSIITDTTPMAIGFSVVVCLVAAFNLILDFATIEQGAEAGAPAYMEWYSAFGLLVTLIWLYMEILRLLRKLRR
jgi:uncharacterized YccA/Bax inhibitor family protein